MNTRRRALKNVNSDVVASTQAAVAARGGVSKPKYARPDAGNQKRSCVCGGLDCVPDNVDAIKLPAQEEERAKWAVGLCLKKGQLLKHTQHVHRRHFSLSAFRVLSKGGKVQGVRRKPTASPTLRYRMTAEEVMQLRVGAPIDRTPPVSTTRSSDRKMCPCASGSDCGYDISHSSIGKVRSPASKSERIAWAKILFNIGARALDATEKGQYDDFISKRKFISKLHFFADQLNQTGGVRAGELPSAKPRIAPASAPLMSTVQAAVEEQRLPMPSTGAWSHRGLHGGQN
jgi:hypothetical protein